MPDVQKPSCASEIKEVWAAGETGETGGELRERLCCVLDTDTEGAPPSRNGPVAIHLSSLPGSSNPSTIRPDSHSFYQPSLLAPPSLSQNKLKLPQDSHTNSTKLLSHASPIYVKTPFGTGPPPPPPPPPPPHSAEPRSRLSRYRYKDSDLIERRHEGLQDSREDLLGTRFQLQTIRKQVRKLREETGTKEGYYIDQLRGFLYEKGIDLPQSIAEAWQSVLESRDALGLLEGRYDNVEEQYHFQEIKYTEDEGRFVDELLSSDPPPKTILQADSSMLASNNITDFAFGWNAHGTARHGPPVDAPIQQLEPQDHSRLTLDNSSLTWTRAPTDRSEPSVPRLTKQHLENKFPPASLGLTETKKHVNAWLFNILSESKFQQARLRDMDPSNDMDCDTWLRLVEQNWHMESAAATYHHTGDSTFSQVAGSQLLSAADLDTFGMEGVDLKTPYPPALTPGDHTLDALEVVSVAPSMQSGDLRDIEPANGAPSTPLHRAEVEHTAPSESTGLARTDMTLPSGKDLSNTTEEVYSCLTSRNRQIPSFHSHSMVYHPTFSDGLTMQPQWSSVTTPRSTTGGLEAPYESPLPSRSDSPRPTTVMSETHTPGWPTELVDYKLEEPRLRGDLDRNVQTHEPHQEPHQEPVPPASSLETLKAPTAWLASLKGISHHLVSLPVQTGRFKPLLQLPFPILPLTSSTITTDSNQPNKADLPFVARNGSPIRLPGPTSDDMYD